MKLELSVVIPTLGSSPHLRGLLERLQRQKYAKPFEVFVVANIPQQQLRKLVNSMGANSVAQFQYLETGKLGVNFARNKGLEKANGEIVLFLDDDMILENDMFLASHVSHHREHPAAAAVGGPYHLTGTNTVWDRAYHKIADEWLRRHTTTGNETTQLLGGNFSLKKEILVRNRFSFDESIGFGGAETGLCRRLALVGQKLLFIESLGINHAPQMTRSRFFRKAFLQGAGARWLSKNISDLEDVFVNAFHRPSPDLDLQIVRANWLYGRFFDFGWKADPYSKPSAGGAPPKLNLFAFGLFLFSRVNILARMRRLHREIYVSTRAAWLNGSASHRHETPPKMEPQT